MTAYITGIAVFLPNKPVHNEKIEDVLGSIGGEPSPLRNLILERNGINWRYYAIDPATREQTHTNAELTKEAILRLFTASNLELSAIELLACGTSSPDQAIPNHAAMVHGLLGCPPCEIVSTAGVCCSSMTALKYAYTDVLAGLASTAVVTGSELASGALKASQFPTTTDSGDKGNSYIGFNQEFLRFMLSDGAGAVLLETEPRVGETNFRIDWIEIRSFANLLETCMYSGAMKEADGSLRGWRMAENPEVAVTQGYFNLSQDVSVLQEHVVKIAAEFIFGVLQRRNVDVTTIDWLLPHLSSMFFQQALFDEIQTLGPVIPLERWFTNLKYKGNTGSASLFIMLEELAKSGKLNSGEQILCVVPESARFTFACMHLTVV